MPTLHALVLILLTAYCSHLLVPVAVWLLCAPFRVLAWVFGVPGRGVRVSQTKV